MTVRSLPFLSIRSRDESMEYSNERIWLVIDLLECLSLVVDRYEDSNILASQPGSPTDLETLSANWSFGGYRVHRSSPIFSQSDANAVWVLSRQICAYIMYILYSGLRSQLSQEKFNFCFRIAFYCHILSVQSWRNIKLKSVERSVMRY